MRGRSTAERRRAVYASIPTAVVLSWLAAGPPAPALDPAKALTQYGIDVWQIEDGLPMNSIRDVLQTRDGFLWLATFEGLTRFDGHEFEVLDSTTAPILRVFLTTLFEGRDGTLWIGAQGGLGRLRRGELRSFTQADGLVHDAVQVIFQDRAGVLWVGTQGGLTRYEEGRFSGLTRADGLAGNDVKAIAEDGDGDLWIGTAQGLSRLRRGEWTTYTTDDGLADDHVTALAVDGGGGLWIGMEGGGLDRLAHGRFTHWGDGTDSVTGLCVDREGSLWIGTQDRGLARLRDGEWSRLGSAEGLADDSVRALFEDREGSLWIGTWGGGLNRLRDGKLTPYTSREGLPGDFALAILEDHEGTLWMATTSGLARFRDGRFRSYTTADGLASHLVRALEEDHEGHLWLGTQGGGLQRLRDGKPEAPITTADGLSHNDVRAILESRDGDLWIATWGGGLNRMHEGRLTALKAADGLAHDFAMALLEDREGSLWIGTGDGLSRLRDGELVSFHTEDGLGSDIIVSLHEEEDGSLWIGTVGGLVRYRDGRFTTFTTAEGLFDDRIFQILDDDRGNFWMSCNRGIFRVRKDELAELAAGRRDHVTSVSYGTADGMKSRECNGGFRPAGWKSRDGKLWFPTIRGVVMADPSHLPTNDVPPPVVIDRLVLGTETIRPHRAERVVLDVRDFEIRYAGLSLRNPERVRFRYRLEGYDDDWIDAGSRRRAFYTNIPPGDHRFQVIASNDDGLWNETGATIDLYLRPAFYETWYFYALCVLGALGLGRGLFLLRVRRLHRRYDELVRLKKELEVKNAEIEAKNAELERYTFTVSHDLKSPLITIKGFLGLLEQDAEDGDAEKVREDVERIWNAADKMQRLLEDLLELSRIGHAANPAEDVELSGLVAEVLELLAERLSGVEVAVAEDLPTVHGDRQRLLAVFQNLIDNAAKYMGSQERPKIEIGARQRSAETLCWVRDNGRGIEARDQEGIFDLFKKLDGESEGTGIGLALVHRIVEVHGGRIWVESEGQGRGAAFFFTLPPKPVESGSHTNVAGDPRP